jgi:hypothetical protein
VTSGAGRGCGVVPDSGRGKVWPISELEQTASRVSGASGRE